MLNYLFYKMEETSEKCVTVSQSPVLSLQVVFFFQITNRKPNIFHLQRYGTEKSSISVRLESLDSANIFLKKLLKRLWLNFFNFCCD